MKNQDCGWRIHTPQSKPYGMAHIYSPGPNAEANATAIAALPDLLEALEISLAACEATQEVIPTEEMPKAIREIRAALAKAGYTFD